MTVKPFAFRHRWDAKWVVSRQPILHPTCVETQTVLRSSSGIIAVSINLFCEVGKRYFFVPSRLTCTLDGAEIPNSYFSLSSSLAFFERLLISSMLLISFL